MNVGLENSTSRRRLLWLLVPSLLFACTGCSLFVMAGKALLGDPKIAAEFRKTTGVDLTDGDDAVVIICSAPHRLQDRYPALQIDIADRVSRNLETRNVKVVPSGDVAGWFDDHGEWGDYSELAEKFDASFVIHIDVREFEHRVPQSENLMQGQAEGRISVHRYQRSEDGKRNEFEPAVTMAFDRDFRLMFPGGYPVPRETRSEDLFVEGFLDRVAQNIGHYFYDVRMSETIY